MPISFESAQPYSPQISYDTGARQQGQIEFENFQRAQQQAAQNYFQQAHLDQADQQFDSAHQQQADQFEQQRQPSDRDRWAAAEEAKQMQARADIHVAMRDQELTQADKMQKQQMQNAIAHVNQRVADGTLLPTEGNDMITQIQTNLNPTLQRERAQQVKIQGMKVEQMQKDAEERSKIVQRNADFFAKNAPSSVIPMPAMGGFGIVNVDAHGNPKIDFHPNPKPEKEPPPPKEVHLRPNDMKTFRDLAEKKFAAVAGDPGAKSDIIENEYRRLVNEWDYQNNPHKFGQAQGQQASPPGQPPQAGPQGPPPQPQAGPPQSVAPPPPPKPMSEVTTEWTPRQTVDVGEFQRDMADLKRTHKGEAVTMLQHALNLYKRTGGPDHMTPQDFQTYRNMLLEADRIARSK